MTPAAPSQEADEPRSRSSVRSLLALPLIVLVQAYRVALSPFLGGRCRFHPSCSVYAIEALKVHGAFRGSWLAMRRLLRCHPLGGHGYDPVPLPRKISKPLPDTTRTNA